MFLTRRESEQVLDAARSYGIDGNPEQLLTDALNAICVGKAEDAAYRVAEAAGVHFIGRFIWMKEEPNLEADRARSILKIGAKHDAYDGPVPEDDEQAVKDAEELVGMAQEAWDSHVRGEAIEAILNEAKNASENGSEPSDQDIAEEPHGEAEKEARGEQEAPQEENSLADVEPWEDYDRDKVAEIIEGIDVFLQEEEDAESLLAHIWAYESAHKSRVRILGHLEKIAKERQDGEEPKEAEEEPQGSGEGEGTPEDSATHEAGTEGEDGDEGGEADSQEAESADSPEADESDAGSEPEGEAGEEGTEDGEPDAPEAAEEAGGSDAPVEEHDLLADVHAELARERLHIPPPIEEAPPEMPFDLTTLSDTELQRLFMMFAAYAYRTNHLLLIQEASSRRAKERADDLHRDLLVASEKYDEHDKAKTMTILEAEVENDPEVKKWRKIQRKHEIFAQSYRAERDSYNKFVEALSRLETMRDNEFDRSGGQRSRRGRG
jgi:hypothetical protein